MHEGLKTILEQLYEQTPDIKALKEALILLVNNGELSIDDIKVLDNHYASEALFLPAVLYVICKAHRGKSGLLCSKEPRP